MNDNLIPLAEEWLANPHNLEPAFRAGQAAPIIDGLLAEVKRMKDIATLAMRTLTHVQDAVWEAAGIPDHINEIEYVCEVIAHQRAEVKRMEEALAPIRELHRPWTIYAECDHQLDDDPHEIGNEHPDSLHHYVYEIGWTCEVMYKVCAECCVDDVYQSEDCANYHDHGPGKPICPTARLVYTTSELENR